MKFDFKIWMIFFRFGTDMTKCRLTCSGKSEVIYKSLQPNALDQLSNFMSVSKPIMTGDKRFSGHFEFLMC